MDTKHKNSMSCDVSDKMFQNLSSLEEHKSKDHKQNWKEISSKKQNAEKKVLMKKILQIKIYRRTEKVETIEEKLKQTRII